MERDRYCTGDTTLENCHALMVTLSDGAQWCVWRDRPPKRLRPIGVKRWRDLRPGCRVVVDGKRELTVAEVIIYR